MKDYEVDSSSVLQPMVFGTRSSKPPHANDHSSLIPVISSPFQALKIFDRRSSVTPVLPGMSIDRVRSNGKVHKLLDLSNLASMEHLLGLFTMSVWNGLSFFDLMEASCRRSPSFESETYLLGHNAVECT